MLKYFSLAATTILSTLMLYSNENSETHTPLQPTRTIEQITTRNKPNYYKQLSSQNKTHSTQDLVNCLEKKIDGKIRFNSQGPVFYIQNKNWPVIIKYGIIRPLEGEPGTIKKESIEEEKAWKEYIKAIYDIEEKNNAILCYKKNDTQFQEEKEKEAFEYKFNVRFKMPNFCKGIYGMIRLNCDNNDNNQKNNNSKFKLSFSNPNNRHIINPNYYQMHIKAYPKIIGTNKIPKTKLVIHKWDHEWNNYSKRFFLKDLDIKLIQRKGGVIKVKPEKKENLDEILEDDDEPLFSQEEIELLQELEIEEHKNRLFVPIQTDELCYCGLETKQEQDSYIDFIKENNPQENPTTIDQRFKEIKDNCSNPIDYQGQHFNFYCQSFQEEE